MNRHAFHEQAPIKIAACYAIAASLWVIASDELLLLAVGDPELLSRLQTVKGGGYVVISALLLYWMVRHYMNELRQGAVQLEISEERFRSMFETAAAGMALMETTGRIISANPALCRLTGYSKTELEAMTFEELTHPDDRPMTRENYDAILSGDVDAFHYEKRYLTRSGQTVWGHASVACVAARAGQPGYCVGLVQDITERKLAEAELEAIRLRLEEIVDFLPDATLVVDDRGRVTAWNRAMEALTGTSKAEAVGRGDLAAILPPCPAERPLVLDGLNQAARLDCRRPCHLWCTSTSLAGPDGGFTGAIESIRDVSDLRETQRRLEAANHELEAFVYTVSHDLRSPLTCIVGYADMLLESGRDRLSDGELAYLFEIATAGGMMAQLIEDLLTLAQVGHLEMPGEPVELAEIARHVASTHQAELVALGATLTIGPLPAARVPATMVMQVLDNLVANALRHGCRNGGGIEVEGWRSGDGIQLCVRDHGPGLPASEREAVFDAFYRAADGRRSKGSGIGLATVRKIATTLGGKAWVEETPGGGCSFCVTLMDGVGPDARPLEEKGVPCRR